MAFGDRLAHRNCIVSALFELRVEYLKWIVWVEWLLGAGVFFHDVCFQYACISAIEVANQVDGGYC